MDKHLFFFTLKKQNKQQQQKLISLFGDTENYKPKTYIHYRQGLKWHLAGAGTLRLGVVVQCGEKNCLEISCNLFCEFQQIFFALDFLWWLMLLPAFMLLCHVLCVNSTVVLSRCFISGASHDRNK